MTAQQLIFYFFSALAILASTMVIVAKNSVRAVLSLVFTFFCVAVLWMLLQSEFLSIILILVYVGAVMVLFLFVVMMLDIEASKHKDPFAKFWFLGLFVAGVMIGMMVLVGRWDFGLKEALILTKPADYSEVKALGTLLYQDYLLPFEIAGVILLVAMVAAIALAFRGPHDVKRQKPGLQAQVRKSDRLRIITMPAENGEQP